MKKWWASVTLGEITNVNMGQSPPSSSYNQGGKGLPFFQGKAEFTHVHPVIKKWCTEPKKIANANDVLISVRAPIGAVNIAENRCAIGRGLAAITYSYCNKFIFYLLKARRDELESYGTGSTFKAISGQTLKSLKVCIPPLPEQRAIVAKIEILFSRLDEGIASLKKAREQLKIYRQAVLKKAFEGEYPMVRLKELADNIGGVTKGKKNSGKKLNSYPYLRVANVQDGYLNLDVIKYIEVTEDDFKKYLLKFEDVLFTEGGDKDKLGRGTVWKNEIENCIHQNHIFRARVDKRKLNPYFLSYYSSSPMGKDYFFKNGKQTTNLASINKTIISSLPIPLPALREQAEIVREIETRFSICDDLEKNIDTALARSEALRQSILKKAFSGELLTETEIEACRREPDWEPAEKLVESIKKQTIS